MFKPNSTTTHWSEKTELCSSNGNVHNEACKIDSQSCSREMSDIADLCQWHRIRMARHVTVICACGIVDACAGDATARRMFRNYYDRWDIPVFDSANLLYCCGECQNTDTETYQCGTRMRVGPCCIDKHPNASPIKKGSKQEDDESEDVDSQDYS
jgi:hypothetical protein